MSENKSNHAIITQLGRCKLEYRLAFGKSARLARRSRATLYTSKLEGRRERKRKGGGEKKKKGGRIGEGMEEKKGNGEEKKEGSGGN